MGIRQTLRSKPWIGIVIALAFVGIAAVVTFKTQSGGMVVSDKAFFSADDGKTTFVDSRSLLAPFQKEGKEVVQVNMFSCDGGKTSFIGYLSKLSDSDKKGYESAAATAAEKKLPPPMMPMTYLVKKPDGTKWFNSMSPEGKQLLNIPCSTGYPEIVHP